MGSDYIVEEDAETVEIKVRDYSRGGTVKTVEIPREEFRGEDKRFDIEVIGAESR